MRFQFIDDHRDQFPVKLMCKVLKVSRSGYYAWRTRPVSAREMANQKLYVLIKAVYDAQEGLYGSPRIYHELKDRVPCSENRTARLMHAWAACQTWQTVPYSNQAQSEAPCGS